MIYLKYVSLAVTRRFSRNFCDQEEGKTVKFPLHWPHESIRKNDKKDNHPKNNIY